MQVAWKRWKSLRCCAMMDSVLAVLPVFPPHPFSFQCKIFILRCCTSYYQIWSGCVGAHVLLLHHIIENYVAVAATLSRTLNWGLQTREPAWVLAEPIARVCLYLWLTSLMYKKSLIFFCGLSAVPHLGFVPDLQRLWRANLRQLGMLFSHALGSRLLVNLPGTEEKDTTLFSSFLTTLLPAPHSLSYLVFSPIWSPFSS